MSKKPEYLVCAKCDNRLKENHEYFYLSGPEFGDENEVIGKCGKCRATFNRVLD